MDSDEDWAGEEAEDYGSDDYSDGEDYDDDSLPVIEDDGEKKRTSESYKALTEEEIRKLQEDAIARVSTSLSISRVGAALLLGQYQWRVDESEDAWFADEDGVRKAIGLLENPVVQVPDSMEEEITCRICFDKFPSEDFAFAACGHLFCKVCYNTYIRIAVEDGSGCLRLKCPEPSCLAAVGQDMVDSLASDEVKSKYDHYLLRSYIENNKKMKWCPAPGCDNAVKFHIGSEVYDVYCLCLNGFCWNCGEDAHRPVDCETVSRWVTKNSAESENVTWLLANSKPCPKCKYPIEKNQGCMHMTCRPPCKFEFCWLCLGAWSEHGDRTGGFFACNKYEEAKLSGKLNEAEEKQRMAKNHIEKYTHYFERWQSNSKSRNKAILDLKNMQNVQIKELSDFQATPESQLKFVVDAWLQIVECRRVLKWTYAYGYYLPSDEKTKKRFFEYLQGEAESALERLHKCAEEDLNKHLKADCSQYPYTYAAQDPNKQLVADSSSSNFADFRVKLITLTVTTRSFFDNLVRALENGLSDVADKEVCTSTEKSRKKSSTKEDGKGKQREQRLHYVEEEGVRRWSCPSCYYMNLENLTTCVNCSFNASENSDGD